MWYRTLRRLLSPHLVLLVSCGFYILFGAAIFQMLESQNLKNIKNEHVRRVDGSIEKYIDRVWELAAKASDSKEMNMKHVFKQIWADSKIEFDQYVDSVFNAHRMLRHGYESDSPSWDFATSFFFTATMLTSIGYGYVTPFTFSGRLFGVIYCLIGIPLMLVTVTNVAKFISETMFLIHYGIWHSVMRWREKSKPNDDGNSSQPTFRDSEDEQDILDRTRLVRFPPIVVFILLFIYGLFGSYIVQKKETWTYSESMYFTFISILTVGFGDYRPVTDNQLTVLIVIFCGMILTTMCMDVLGRMYLEEIHYIGRRLRTSDPFYYLREAKKRRKRRTVANLMAMWARGIMLSRTEIRNYGRKGGCENAQCHESRVLADENFMFARQPPDPPREVQVISTSAYSVRLAWAPAFSVDNHVTYNIRYRLKHKENSPVLELIGIQGNSVEIMSVDSCSLYEFRITAKSRYGESKPVILVQYTGYESSFLILFNSTSDLPAS